MNNKHVKEGQVRMCGTLRAVILRRKSRDEVVIGWLHQAGDEGAVAASETRHVETARTWPVVGKVKLAADPRSPTLFRLT